jgi:hypothetical protein
MKRQWLSVPSSAGNGAGEEGRTVSSEPRVVGRSHRRRAIASSSAHVLEPANRGARSVSERAERSKDSCSHGRAPEEASSEVIPSTGIEGSFTIPVDENGANPPNALADSRGGCIVSVVREWLRWHWRRGWSASRLRGLSSRALEVRPVDDSVGGASYLADLSNP